MVARRIKIVVFCPEPIEGGCLAGPNIRAVAMARRFAGRFDVTLALPQPTDFFADESFATRLWTRHGAHRWIGEYDVAVSQGTQYSMLACLAAGRKETVQVFDLYNPILFEILAADSQPRGRSTRQTRYLGRLTALLLKRADYVVCAAPQQRDLWLGAFYIVGRFAPGSYYPRPDELVGLVPFGHDGDRPQPGKRVLKGVRPGIGPDDKVLLWGGGIWNWFDPLTLIRAMAEIRKERSDVKLFFLGKRPPDEGQDVPEMARAVVDLTTELELLDNTVFFNESWVPFDERSDYLLESDLAVCTAPEGLENAFSFRTRLVDAIWAGVPIVCTHEGFMADFVESHGAGYCVRAGDPLELKRKIMDALEPDTHACFKRNIEESRDELSWDRCMEPLLEFCGRIERGEYKRSSEPFWQAWSEYLTYKVPSTAAKILDFFSRK